MLRKLGLALFTVAIVIAGSASLSTSASARGGWHGGGWHGGGWHGGWHGGGWGRGWGWGPRFYGGPAYYGYYGAYGGCVVRRLVPTPWGWRYRWVNRCY